MRSHSGAALRSQQRVSASKNVTLRSSFPAAANGWRAVASVIGPLGAGEQMAVHPYVLCGKASGSQSAGSDDDISAAETEGCGRDCPIVPSRVPPHARSVGWFGTSRRVVVIRRA